MNFRVLSTKLLTKSQQQLLLNTGISFVHANFIAIKPLLFNVDSPIKEAIFTSKNALTAIQPKNLKIEQVFCVGSKTKTLAEADGHKVAAYAENAEELAAILINDFADKDFVFFCGKRRRDILPKMLQKHSITCKEVIVYDTQLTPKVFEGSYNGVLFFSPSAVESFFQKNRIAQAVAFCIGKSTATAAKKYTNKIVTANMPSVENVIVQVHNYAKQYQH